MTTDRLAEAIACCEAHDPDACLIGNVTAGELRALLSAVRASRAAATTGGPDVPKWAPGQREGWWDRLEALLAWTALPAPPTPEAKTWAESEARWLLTDGPWPAVCPPPGSANAPLADRLGTPEFKAAVAKHRARLDATCACHDDGPPLADGRCATCLLPKHPAGPAAREDGAGGEADPCACRKAVAGMWTSGYDETCRSFVRHRADECEEFVRRAAPAPGAAPATDVCPKNAESFGQAASPPSSVDAPATNSSNEEERCPCVCGAVLLPRSFDTIGGVTHRTHSYCGPPPAPAPGEER